MMDATPLVKWMRERHEMYIRRFVDGRAPPWTDDPVMREFRFCNVYRELDTVTIWIRENIREPFADHPHLWFMLAIARRINLPSTLEEIIADRKGAWPRGKTGTSYNPERMRLLLDDRTARGAPVYTGAYMITAETGPEHTGQTKSRTTAYSNLGRLWAARATVEPQLHGTLQGAFEAILGKGFAWGPFMTYEVVTDLRHTRYLCHAPDRLTWANAGPGALRGLNRLEKRPLTAPRSASEANAAMIDLLKEVRMKWQRPSPAWPALELRDIEHSLCETDKWLRVMNGEGKPRSKYRPSMETR